MPTDYFTVNRLAIMADDTNERSDEALCWTSELLAAAQWRRTVLGVRLRRLQRLKELRESVWVPDLRDPQEQRAEALSRYLVRLSTREAE